MTHPRPTSTASIVALLVMAASSTALAQVDLFSNGSADPTAPALLPRLITETGVPAPSGSFWSEVQAINLTEANAIGGFSTHSTGLTGAFRFADDFTVPAPGWRLTRAAFFAYQTDALTTSPFAGINVRIWSGPPGAPGSVIVYGDTSTNRLASSTPTNIYRVFSTMFPPQSTSLPNKLVWRTEANLSGCSLAPGSYWIDWQYTTTDPLNEAFSPPVTTLHTRSLPAWNAVQFKPSTQTWTPIMDPGKPTSAPDLPQDMPFILRGVTFCAADFNADGAANSQDFFDFLGAFFVDDPRADVNHDSVINSQDFFDFLVVFFAGCP